MTPFEEYRQKLKTPDEAVKAVKSGDWVDYCSDTGFPVTLDRALAKRKGEVTDVKIRTSISIKGSQTVIADRFLQYLGRIQGGISDRSVMFLKCKILCLFHIGNLRKIIVRGFEENDRRNSGENGGAGERSEQLHL